MPLKVADLKIGLDVVLGDADEDEDSEIVQEFISPVTEEPLVAVVVGRVYEIMTVDTGLHIAVLSPPLSPSVIDPTIYGLQHLNLEAMELMDDEDARIVLGVESWSQASSLRVIVRFTNSTTIGLNLVSDVDILRFSTTFPLIPSGRPVLEIGAMVLCRVLLFRKDTPLPWARTHSARIPYNREYWLEATHMGRFTPGR
ncbi:hypothetical protein C8R43DRAFT_1238866 [Mycena crocata]|nr:hypothetical protein C8R43DRAFT_1238866 [Mycena crocata]